MKYACDPKGQGRNRGEGTTGARRRAAYAKALSRVFDGLAERGTLSFESKELSQGNTQQIRTRLQGLIKSCHNYGRFPACYTLFGRLVAGIRIAEERIRDPRLGVQLFNAARGLFNTDRFDIHHLMPVRDTERCLIVNEYLTKFMRYAANDLEKELPALIKQLCTDQDYIAGLDGMLGCLLKKVPNTDKQAIGNQIVAQLLQQANFIRFFALPPLIRAEISDPVKRERTLNRLKLAAAHFVRFATDDQRQQLLKAVCAKEREIERKFGRAISRAQGRPPEIAHDDDDTPIAQDHILREIFREKKR